ncbi:MAG TPA: DUF3159 domain-containing protein [Pseudonocardiaceae bacterium]
MTDPAASQEPGPQESAPQERRAPTLLEQMGGVGGLVASVVPVVVFVAMNTFTGLRLAIWVSLGAAVAVGLWRLTRREALQPALSGLLGVAVCGFIAYRTGEARGFFLYGIWYSLVAGLVLIASVVVRRPLVGVLWSVLNGSSFRWRTDRGARLRFDVATLVWAVFLLARFVVQRWLYQAQETDWLGVARLAMGLPLTAVAALVTIWAIRHATLAAGDRSSPPWDDAEQATDRVGKDGAAARYHGWLAAGRLPKPAGGGRPRR